MKVPVSRDPQVVARRILDAAQAEFAMHGFEGASTNRIARRFGGSKATLFRYFPTKEALLEAVVRRIAAEWRNQVDGRTLAQDSPQGWLSEFARRTLTWILGEGPLFVGRLAIAEGHKFPELERVFQETAGDPLKELLAQRLRSWTRAGHLDCRDPRADAEHFLDLIVSGPVSRRLYGQPLVSESKLKVHIERGVALFLHGCIRNERTDQRA